MKFTASLLFALLIAAPARADRPAETAALQAALEIARAGGLGFAWPEELRVDIDERYGGCLRGFASLGCTPVADEEPIEDSRTIEPVYALTSRRSMQTTFFRGAAEPQNAITVGYAHPDEPDAVRIVAPQPFTALEMAAYVIGHEVHGHLLRDLGGAGPEEMICNYYGLEAVQALRAYMGGAAG